MRKGLLIAVDGPAASGKGALGRRLAEHLKAVYLDTGKLYRLVAYKLLQTNKAITNDNKDTPEIVSCATEVANTVSVEELSNPDLSQEKVGNMASIVAAIPDVRKALLEFQHNVAKSTEGAVLDGRDIGTVVCPEADFKFFITADTEIRAERRYKELQNKGKSVMYSSVLEDLEKRDEWDKGRKASPLIAADDAVVIDTSQLGLDDVFEKVLSHIQSNT